MGTHGTWARSPGTHLVAITRWGHPPEQALSTLAPLLGLAAYDLRLRIMAPLPVVLESSLSPESAQDLSHRIRSLGHEALTCDQDQIPSSLDMFQPRDFSFGPGMLTLVANPNSPGVILATDEIAALIKATQAVDVSSDSQIKTKKFSAGRAIATGGLVRKKKVNKQISSQQEEREAVLYLFSRSEPRHLFFTENSLHYAGLGDQKSPTRSENFATFIGLLRAQAPAALYDESLWVRRRQSQLVSSTGAFRSSTSVHSNTSQNDLSAWLIAISAGAL